MKKEKTVRSYKRKTKSGKVVTVKQHTAKYDAAEAFKEALAKKGAGSELATKQLTEKELKQVQDIVEENSELDEQYLVAFYPELSPKMVKAVMAAHKAKSATPKAKAANTAGKSPKSETPDLGFTADEYKAWYHWDMDKDPKNPSALKVKKALVAAMGPRAYHKYEDDMTDNYTARGDKKAFGAVGELVQARKDAYNARVQERTARAQASIAKAYGATEAAEKHSARAKENTEKRKAATAKIGELSPKGIDYAKIDNYQGDPANLSTQERKIWNILHGYYKSEEEPRLRKQKSLANFWKYFDGTRPVPHNFKSVKGSALYEDESGWKFRREHAGSGLFVQASKKRPAVGEKKSTGGATSKEFLSALDSAKSLTSGLVSKLPYGARFQVSSNTYIRKEKDGSFSIVKGKRSTPRTPKAYGMTTFEPMEGASGMTAKQVVSWVHKNQGEVDGVTGKNSTDRRGNLIM